MSFLVYQRADPRCKDWLPLVSQQIRLRNVIQIIGLNLEVESREDEVYFTLHTRAMSTPFFTSEKLQNKRRIVTWKEIEPRQIPESVRLSAPGFIIRVWSVASEGGGTTGSIPSSSDSSLSQPQQRRVASWGIYLGGLYYLGSKGDWNTKDFASNTILLRMPFGFFTSLDSFLRRPLSAFRYLQIQVPTEQIRSSYTLKKLSSLHSVQRSVLEEVSLGQDLKSRICLYGFSQDVDPTSSTHSQIYGEKSLLRIKEGKLRLQLKEKIESMRQRVSILRDEKVRRFGSVIRLKQDFYDCEDISMDLMGRMQMLGREIERLREMKAIVQAKKIQLSLVSTQLFRRKKELISELLLIYPLSLVEGSKKYSINEIQLPDAEYYGTETAGQLSVALGYTAHLTAMIGFFLGIPLRYSIFHFGSQSRIVDHITQAITDKEREFPLYFRSKEDVYSKYAVYLLNKNIAQLRWYCGLSTAELRATLPNLHNLLNARLTIPGWPPSPTESFEMAQELTEEVDQQLFSSVSLDKGLDQLVSPENGIENTWLRASFSDLECAGGNNAVPSGEVKHGKTQDRFLNGWRKKTYESEEIDPRCLTNSLNLDFDGGRRLSTSSNLSPNGPFRPPLVFISDDSKNVRRRRFGRVEHIPFSRRGSASSKGKSPEPQQTLTLLTTFEPNANLSHIEKEITKFERRRSFCNSSTPSPTQVLGSPVDDHDISFSLPLLANEDMEGENTEEENKDVHDVAEVATKQMRQINLERLEAPTTDEHGHIIDEEESLHNTHHQFEPKYDPSSDERGDSPLPSPFIHKLSSEIGVGAPIVITPTPTKADLTLCTDQSDEGQEMNPLNFPIDDEPTFESSYKIQVPTPSIESLHTLGDDEGEDSLLSSYESTTGSESTLKHSVDEDGDIDEDFGTDFENESLWLRTAALLNPQSFNVIKRRVSESN